MGCERTACAHPTASRPHQAQVNRGVVVLLHGSAGSSALWKGMATRLAPAYDIVAPDLIGYGEAEPWPKERALLLEDEARRVEGFIPCCDGDFHLVGYSYGGAVALALALREPPRIMSLTLVEPVIFGALKRWGDTDAFGALKGVQARFSEGLSAGGDPEIAMQDFIDFWTGKGAWARLPAKHRQAALSRAQKVRLDWEVSFAFDPSPYELSTLAKRTLLVRGDQSPGPMIRLVEALHSLMPGSELRVIRGANHLAPLTHEPELLQLITGTFLAAEERRLR